MNSLLLERPKEAIASYGEPLEVKRGEAWYNRGVVLMTTGQFQEAIANFDKILEIEPNLYQVWFNRGIVLGKLERHEEAITNLDNALTIQPDLYEAWYNRGVALLYLRCCEEAIISYDKALEIQPDLHQAWNNRGGCTRRIRTLRRSNHQLQQSSKLQARLSLCLEQLG